MAKPKKEKRKMSPKQKAQAERLKKAHKACSRDHEPFTKAFGACMRDQFASAKKGA